jgi:hypothetical protein
MALSNAERQRRYREKQKVERPTIIHFRNPKDRRTRPRRWAEAVAQLRALIEDYQSWRDTLPESLRDSCIATQLDAIIELESHLDDLDAAELPRGFGRD